MKKFLQRVVLVAVAMATAQVAVAESWRINNDPAKGAHFASINDAMASEDVKDGDVLYLDPGCVLTTAQTISKEVTVIGTGWDFSDRPYGYAQISKALAIQAAAKIIGIYISSGGVTVEANNVTIERCHIKVNVSVSSSVNYFSLLSSFLNNAYVSGGGNLSSTYTKYATISNCIINITGGTSASCLNCLDNATLTNNILLKTSTDKAGYACASIKNSVLKNNIMIHRGDVSRIENACSGNVFANNCLSAAETSSYASSNVCMNTTDLSVPFVNNGAAGGAAFQLCEGSPAIGAGEGGIDCGPYSKGSLYPFVTYGMPKHIPYFTEAAVPAQPTDGKVKVSLKIVNQND